MATHYASKQRVGNTVANARQWRFVSGELIVKRDNLAQSLAPSIDCNEQQELVAQFKVWMFGKSGCSGKAFTFTGPYYHWAFLSTGRF